MRWRKQSREERLADRDHACHLAERVADALRAGTDPREFVTAEQCRWLADIERNGRDHGGLHADQSHDLQKRLWSERQPDYGDAATMFWEMPAEEYEAPERPLQRFVLKRHDDKPDLLRLVRRKTSTLPDVPVLMLDADFARASSTGRCEKLITPASGAGLAPEHGPADDQGGGAPVTQTATRTLPGLDPHKIRFAVGIPNGPRSAWWYVHMVRGGHVYVGVNSLGEHLKLSLHRDRYCQFGVPRRRLDTMRMAGLPVPKEHYFFRWPRPTTPESGAIHVMSLIIPTDFLNESPPPDESSKKRLPLFPPAPAGHALEFAIYYSIEPATRSLEDWFLRKWRPMIYNKLDTGETVHFVRRVIPFDTPAFKARDWGRPSPFSNEIQLLQPGASLTGLAAISWNDPHAEGCIRLWEASNVTVTLSKEAEASVAVAGTDMDLPSAPPQPR